MTDDDSIDHIPPMVPTRDEVVARAQNATRKAGQRQGKPVHGGAGLLARLFIMVSLVVAAVACAWVWQLQQKLVEAESDRRDLAGRVAELEDRLSDTDAGMSQSSAAMAVKIKELYSEVDKLWASAWRTNKAKIANLEKAVDTHADRLATLGTTDKGYSAQLQSLAADIKKLQAVLGGLEKLTATAKASEARLESLADDLNRSGLEYAKLQKRVSENEEWVESINGFRKQVNGTLSELRLRLIGLQAGAADGP